MDRLTDASRLNGWIPSRVSWRQGRALVDWCYLGRKHFKDSFFDQTLDECMGLPFNLLFGQQTPIEVLGQLHELRPGLKPKGFIFHLSRSGSTLVSQMLAALPANIVISEARPIDSVLRAYCHDSSISAGQRMEWLRWMISALAQPRRGGEQNFFVKFDAWNIFELSQIELAFPEVPWIFVYRDPIEVLVSQMNHRGAHMIPGVINPQLFGIELNLLAQIEPEEYCARVLGAICETALELSAKGGLLINYQQLPDAVLSSISEFFGVRWTEAESETMKRATRHHSKSPEVVYQSDSVQKRTKASEQLREAAQRWVYPVYGKLEAKRLSLSHQV